jgi:hypothetical protein
MNTKKELNNLTIRKTMNTVEINKSIMELNYKKEQLKNEVDILDSTADVIRPDSQKRFVIQF